MRSMFLRTQALALFVCMLAPAASVAERASFDCAKAQTPAEKAICASARLARLDRALNAAYQKLKTRLPVEGEAFIDEQKRFLAKRDACGVDAACIANIMEERRAALALERKPASDPRARFIGRYENRLGWVLIRRNLDGAYEFSGSSAEPESARWVCDVSGTIVGVSKGIATVEAGENNDSRPVKLSLSGAGLIVTEDEDRRLAGYSCGANGYIEGRYRRAAP